MRALVVFESMFGNTEAIAQAIGDGVGSLDEVTVQEVGCAPSVGDGLDLIIVGGPTHAFGLSRPSTRATARQQAPDGRVVSAGRGVREWLDQLPASVRQQGAAAFDTRVTPVRVPGSAARGIAKRLKARRFALVLPAQTFWVTATPGPLSDGELERARQWGANVRRALALVLI
jgi:hypothetical protein